MQTRTQRNVQMSRCDARLEILGDFRLFVGGQDLSDQVSRSSKLKSLLCYLILHRERAVSRDELIEIFYEDEDQRDPVAALKMQIMRIRQMLAPALPQELSAVIGRRGTYQWNPALSCLVDAEAFEDLCLLAEHNGEEPQQACGLYREALDLYIGDPALDQDGLLWSETLVSRLRSRYISASETYAGLLMEQGNAFEAENVCLRAIDCDPVGEACYIVLIRALLLQRKYAEARTHYKNISNTLYRMLGVRPSNELQRLYDGIVKGEAHRETDLDVVMDAMREKQTLRTAFFCGFEQFRSIYQLEARRAARTGTCMHVVMLSIGEEHCGDTAMEQVQQTVIRNLRSSDVVARYSGSQLIIMLLEADLEDSNRVMERIARVHDTRCPGTGVQLSWQIRQMEIL